MTLQKDPFLQRGKAKIKKIYRQRRWRRWCQEWNSGENDQKILLKAMSASSKTEAVHKFRHLEFPTLIDTDPDPQFAVVDGADTYDIFGQAIRLSDLDKLWHLDITTSKQWPKIWHWQVEKVGRDGSDVKFPWELSRCQFLMTWAQHYAVTKNEKYTQYFRDAILSWIENNPPGIGVNWTCAMDTAIRASNWLAVIGAFKDSDILDDEFFWKLLKSLYFHGCYITNNLEGPGWYAANHYLADIAGLFFIGHYLGPILEDARTWQRFAIKALESEGARQVLPDGFGFEDSSFYHRLTFELLFYPFWLSEISSQNIFSERYVQRLKKMLSASGAIIRPDGSTPQIGDNDSGQFFRLCDHDITSLNYLMDIGVLVFGLNELKFSDRPASISAQALLGAKAVKQFDGIKVYQRPTVQQFADTGWTAIHKTNWDVALIAGPRPGLTAAAHAHEDRMSFELSYQGKPVIIDPGTYSYTAHTEFRRLLRSCISHNVLSCKNHPSDDTSLFSNLSPESASDVEVRESPFPRWEASSTLNNEQWTRSATVESERFLLSDAVSDPVGIFGTLIFDQNVKVRIVDEATAVVNEGHPEQLWIRFTGISDQELIPIWVSPRYGLKFPSTALRYRINASTTSLTVSKV